MGWVDGLKGLKKKKPELWLGGCSHRFKPASTTVTHVLLALALGFLP